MLLSLELVLCAAALALLVPVTVLTTEIMFALDYDGESVPPETGERRRLAVLVPAHDEALIIASTLRSVIPHLTSDDRLLVVADNCSDDTATIATNEGAEVIVRSDALRRGKGYALDCGVRHLERDRRGAPEIVVIIDADCQVSEGAIDRLARMCARTGRSIQAMYLMHSADETEIKMRIAEFAWAIKNKVRPLGLQRLGLSCQLMGTGMAFPWACISTANLASGHIVEDLQLGVELALAGTPPLFCPHALVSSHFPSSEQGIASQRVRWEHGYLGVILAEAGRLFAVSFKTMNGTLLMFALDLCVPPIALLVLLLTMLWSVSAVVYLTMHLRAPIILSSIALLLLAVGIGSAWRKYGRHILSPGDLARTLMYALRKIPLYARFLGRRQSEWVRSKRDKDLH